MADIYVSPTGSDTSGDGSPSNPYQHIHKAIDVALDGDTIICLDGIYNEEEYRVINKNLTIRSNSQDFTKVIIKPKTYHICVEYEDASGNKYNAKSYPYITPVESS